MTTPLKISVTVKPGARREEVRKLGEGEFQVSVKAPAREGKANLALIALLAEYFSVSKSRIRILSGAGGRKKLLEIS